LQGGSQSSVVGATKPLQRLVLMLYCSIWVSQHQHQARLQLAVLLLCLPLLLP
jgi:hypothetical protein